MIGSKSPPLITINRDDFRGNVTFTGLAVVDKTMDMEHPASSNNYHNYEKNK